MDIKLFNLCLLVGWLMLTVGACIVHLGYGLAVGGLVLLALTFASAFMAGVHASPGKKA